MTSLPGFKLKGKFVWAIAAVAVLLFMSTNKLVALLTDFLWFRELHLEQVFATSLITRVVCFAAAGLFAWIIIYSNIFIAERVSKRSPNFAGAISAALAEFFKVVPLIHIALLATSVIAAFMVGGWAGNFWDVYLRWRHAVPFGALDPLFHKDISFYVFSLPFFRFVYFVAIISLLLSTAGALLVYIVRQNVGWDGQRFEIAPAPRAHLLIMIGLIVLALGGHFLLRMYGMVTAAGTTVNGAGYADIHFGVPLLKSDVVLCIVAALLIWINAGRRGYRFAIAGVLLLAIGTIGGKFVTQAVQKLVVGPDELNKETPYIGWSIANTRTAYDLDKIEARHFTPTASLTADLLKANELTVNNIRLWDHGPLKTTYAQLQEIRSYYDFLDVDNDRYVINGKSRQVMLSPRELVPASLPERNWINEHLTYTHGYGLCLGPVNSVTQEGLPVFFTKNIPPQSTDGAIPVSRPEIYFGESDAGYAIVKTGAKEFDYPSGNENVYSDYQGSGGIQMNSAFKKLLFAARFGELKILLRNDISRESRILFGRQIMERVNKALPFLSYDSDPYMVITADGRMVWIVDGYTVSDAYPYSAPMRGIGNYIRNSVKVVIDAYSGTTTFYIADSRDPIINTWSRIFPGAFHPIAEMPADIRSHVRYPQTIFTIQARVYSVYHMTDPQVFYNKEDVWRIPKSFSEGQEGAMKPYYTIMKLAEVGTQEEFILMVPFCPSKKENMIAWLAARCDGADYGKLLVFDFPKAKLVYGPSQIESRINQDPEISKQLTLWNQGGSRVIRGSLLVIPVEQSLIFVQPLYIAAENGGVPELKRVIVAYENSIAMEETLEKSLSVIFGTSNRQPSATSDAASYPVLTGGSSNINSLISEANHQFELGRTEMQRGNWAGYGSAMKEVERLLGELARHK